MSVIEHQSHDHPESTAWIAWVVDLSETAILCRVDEGTQGTNDTSDAKNTHCEPDDPLSPVALPITKHMLDNVQAHDYAFINPTTILDGTDAPLADMVINSTAVRTLGICIPGNQQFVTYRRLVNRSSRTQAMLISHALQLMRWRDRNRYCPRCQSPLVIHPSEYAACCDACHDRSYPQIQPCIISAITRTCPQHGTPQILLAQHHHHQDGMYGLIAGFVEIGEALEAAVRREVHEEVGVKLGDLHYITSQPWPYPTNLMIGFWATYATGDIHIQASELAHAGFFDFEQLPKIPRHGTIARTLIEHVARALGVQAIRIRA